MIYIPSKVNIYIKPPPGVTKSALDIRIEHLHISIGLKGAPPFIDVNFDAV